tara:strand:+ start:3790 stop:4491 length:702 start_codon:yes stop_codon:yes gene_type:complete
METSLFISYDIFNKKVKYDKNKYPFVNITKKIFDCSLSEIHTLTDKNYPLFTVLGKDTHTNLHKIFYTHIDEVDSILKELYKKFIKEIIFPFLNLKEGLYQVFPTFRVMLPNNVAVVKKHYDSDIEHRHPKGEINFVIALTEMYDTNSIWSESYPRLGDFKPFNLTSGDVYCFCGNLCEHFNKINRTGKTRISMDFRILPNYCVTEINHVKSVTTGKKFSAGGYYDYLILDNK